MAFCPNPDCPHKKKIGRPAEFREGFTHCSDCGSPLSEKIIEKEDAQETPHRIRLTGLHKRILYTIGFVALWRVLAVVPAPGINFQALEQLFSSEWFFQGIFGYGSAHEKLSVVTLGIMPYLSAYMIVEILSLFIQPLKSWREQGVQGRIKIKKVAFFAAFLFALVQGYGIGDSLEHMVGVAGEKVVINPGFVFFLVLILTLTAGTFLTAWIAELITKNGIGHGISILIFVGYGPEIFSNLPQLRLVPRANSPTPLAYFLLLAIIVVASTALIILMERSYRKIPVRFSDNVEAYVPLKFTSAGLIPAFSGVWLIAFPITVLEFMRRMGYEFSRKLIEALTSPGIWYYMAHAVTIFLLYYLFVSFFYDPRKIVNFLKNKQASIGHLPVENREEYIDKSLEFMVPIAALYLCVVVFAPNAILGPFFFFHIDSIKLITAVAVLLDLLEEMRARTKGSKLVKVAELHDVPMAGLLKSLFEQKGVPCYLRGYYHRALLYFFGPYIEISVLVPEDRMSEAKEVIETYLDEKILAVRSPKALGA